MTDTNTKNKYQALMIRSYSQHIKGRQQTGRAKAKILKNGTELYKIQTSMTLREHGEHCRKRETQTQK